MTSAKAEPRIGSRRFYIAKNMSKVNREQLLNDLQMVKAGVSPREFIEQSSCFVFQDGMVMTFNDEVACRKKTCLNAHGAVQAGLLTSILERLDDPELLVRENEKGELEFQGKRKGFGVVKDAEIFLPIDRVEVPEKWKPLPPEFTEAVGLVRHCVSTDENKFLLTCIHLHPEWIEACDNMQLMRVQLSTGLKDPVLVRGTSLEHITALAMNEIALTPAWVHFRNKSGLVFSCRRYTEEYPALEPILKVKGHPVSIPRGLADASDRAALFAADKAGEPLMSVSLKDDTIRITGEGLAGWYKEIKKTRYQGPPLKFLIAPDLLKHISEKYSNATIGTDKLKVSGGQWTYCTVLGRKEKEAEAPAEDSAPRKVKKGKNSDEE